MGFGPPLPIGGTIMATVFELWNDDTNNLIDDFDTLDGALDEVRWRIGMYGAEATASLSLLRSDNSGGVKAIAVGEEMIRLATMSATLIRSGESSEEVL